MRAKDIINESTPSWVAKLTDRETTQIKVANELAPLETLGSEKLQDILQTAIRNKKEAKALLNKLKQLPKSATVGEHIGQLSQLILNQLEFEINATNDIYRKTKGKQNES